MPEEIMGLPAHPLIVHAPVIFVPLLAVVAVLYLVAMPLRRMLVLPLVGLAVIAPLSAFVAKLSGENFQERLAAANRLGGELADKVEEHEHLGTTMLWWTLGLGVAALVLVAVTQRGGSARGEGDGGVARGITGRPFGLGLVALVVGIVVLGLSGVSTYYVVRTGHTGATMVWEGS